MSENHTYTCDYCGGVYEKGWSDEEALQEAEMIFGSHPDQWEENGDGIAVVCDLCFQKMHPFAHPELLAEARKRHGKDYIKEE